MSDLKEQINKYFKPKPKKMDFESLIRIVEQTVTELGENQKQPLNEAPTGAKERERVLRLPNMVATEISVGQRPGSEDRQQFELWMSNLGMEGPGDSSAVAAKLTNITNFFENPEANLAEATIPQTLSYLMFLNQFVWMIKEFNASVAGFLWEPFLAALFGGPSKQVPTSEGDIADIRIYPAGSKVGESISLKILNATGDVKGSFKDLVGHFAEGGTSMRYVIVVKDQSKKAKDVSAVTFYEFDITAKTFFDWIGAFKYTETIISQDKKFKANRDLKKTWLQHVASRPPRFEIRHAEQRPGKRAKADPVAKHDVAFAVFNEEEDAYFIVPEAAEIINLRLADGTPAREGVFDPTAEYIAAIAHHTPGGQGGATMQKGYAPLAGVASGGAGGTDKLWGGVEELSQWARLRDEGWDGAKLFQAIRDGVTLDDGTQIPPAPGITGAKGETQFHITPAHYRGMASAEGTNAGKLGTLRITTKKVEDFFTQAASRMNDDLIVMFNSLADLTDNIGRFFLVDCGGKQCTDKDASNRNQAGQNAISDSQELQRAVTASVQKQDAAISPQKE